MKTIILGWGSAARSLRSLQESNHDSGGDDDYLLPIVFLAILALVVLWGIWFSKRRTNQEKKWETGVFPIDFPYNRDHLMEAYIAAAGTFARKDDWKFLARKLVFINGYLQREFRDVYYDFKDSYDHSLRHPVTLASLAAWLNLYLKTNEEKQKIVDFLLALAWYDGQMSGREYQELKGFVLALELDWTVIQERIEQQMEREKAPVPHTVSDRKHYTAVLGLDENADKELIKSTYRKLVKLYHPDKFMQDTPETRREAEAKFREVQEAYEYLMQ